MVPYEVVVDACATYRDPQFAPLFQIGFDVRDERLRDSGRPELELAVMERDIGLVQYDLHLTMEPAVDGMTALWSYNTDLYDAVTIARLAEAFVQVANAAAAEPARACGRLPLLAPAMRRQLLEDFNATHMDLPLACVHEQISAYALTRAHDLAVEFEAHQLSYADLERAAASVAAALQAAGVVRGDRVAVAVQIGRAHV